MLSTFGAVDAPWFDDRPVFLLGGGASLDGFSFSRLSGLGYCVGINQSTHDADCDCAVSIDFPFVRGNRDQLTTFAARRELYLAIGNSWPNVLDPIEGAIYLRDGEAPLSFDPGAICRAKTSGFGALNLAVLKRARRIVLLGFDYGPVAGRFHYHDAYRKPAPSKTTWAEWAKSFDAAAPILTERGIMVVNASPQSAIGCFPKMSIDNALQWAQTE